MLWMVLAVARIVLRFATAVLLVFVVIPAVVETCRHGAPGYDLDYDYGYDDDVDDRKSRE